MNARKSAGEEVPPWVRHLSMLMMVVVISPATVDLTESRNIIS